MDEPLRKAILAWGTDHLGDPRYVWNTYLSHFGCAELSELVQRLEDRYGADTVEAFRANFEEIADRRDVVFPFQPVSGGFATFQTANDALSMPLDSLNRAFAATVPQAALLALPEGEFLTALENVMDLQRGSDQHDDRESYRAVQSFINSRFKTLGVPYQHGSVPGSYDPNEIHFDAEPGVVEFYRLIDPKLEEKVINPALRVLADSRLNIAARNYNKGLRRVVAKDERELEDAVLDFSRAVQNALFALVEAVGKKPRSDTPGALFGQLKGAPLPDESEALVLAASKIRNPVEHPRGRLADIRHATAEAAMGAASVAITYIASFMPSPPGTKATADFATMMDDDIPF